MTIPPHTHLPEGLLASPMYYLQLMLLFCNTDSSIGRRANMELVFMAGIFWYLCTLHGLSDVIRLHAAAYVVGDNRVAP